MNVTQRTEPRTSLPLPEDLAFQDHALRGVSRTFALTIPELPPGLREVVGNGYLLCRIADTIEDDPGLESDEKHALHGELQEALCGRSVGGAELCELAARFASAASPHVRPAERELLANLDRVLRVTRGFTPARQEALARCVRTMCDGMDRFQSARRGFGLRDVHEMHEYCYYVAGVVGELLTELFCDHSDELRARRCQLEERSVAFGLGLQMTNILKDVWDDRERGFCWLPRDVFQRRGVELRQALRAPTPEGFRDGIEELVALAHGHLRRALEYTLLVPAHEHGIRRFCLWSLGMAVLTLRKIARNPGFARSRDVKIRRSSVRATVLASKAFGRSDLSLRLLFGACARGLPGPAFVH